MVSFSKFALVSGMAAEGRTFLKTDRKVTVSMEMNPVRVAQLIKQTQSDWVDLALTEPSKETAEAQMVSSCQEITESMVKSSDGEKSRVNSYFGEVCSVYDREQAGAGKDDKARCQNFGSFLLEHMSEDSEVNREKFESKKACNDFWNANVEAYAKQAAAEREAKAAAEAEAKRVAEEKKAEEEKKQKAEAAKKAEEEKKRLAEKEAELAKKMKAAQDKAEGAKTKIAEGKKKISAVLEKAGEGIKTIDRVLKPVLKEQQKDEEESLVKKMENIIQRYESKFVSYLNFFMGRPATMADTYVKEKNAEPSNHSVYQSAVAAPQVAAVKVVKTAAVSSDVAAAAKKRVEEALARAQKQVAEKADAAESAAAGSYSETSKAVEKKVETSKAVEKVVTPLQKKKEVATKVDAIKERIAAKFDKLQPAGKAVEKKADVKPAAKVAVKVEEKKVEKVAEKKVEKVEEKKVEKVQPKAAKVVEQAHDKLKEVTKKLNN